MQLPSKNRFGKIVAFLASLFVLLFILRLSYGYFFVKNSDPFWEGQSSFMGNLDNLRKNYASEKYKKSEQANSSEGQNLGVNSQKYEKTATISSQSTVFEQDEKTVRELTQKMEGIIQYEKRAGNTGNRELFMMIGISPDRFDEFYEQVLKIGKILRQEVSKTDKTNEFRELNAQKISLEKNLQSLSELKAKGGNIGEYITLHEKILEIENQLQKLGVDLGNFDTENEFCTIRFVLLESKPEAKISLAQRLKVALEWTIKYYAVLIFSLCCLAGTAFFLTLLLEKLPIFLTFLNKPKE